LHRHQAGLSANGLDATPKDAGASRHSCFVIRVSCCAAALEPAHQRAHHGQLFVQLFGGIPVVAVQRIRPSSASTRCEAPRTVCNAVIVLECKQEIPGQEALLPLHHAAGDDKAGLVERHIHVLKDVPDGVHALHLVERVFEACIGRIDASNGARWRA
jgi:hypothetical protein